MPLITDLNDMIDAAQAENRRLRALNAELIAALQGLYEICLVDVDVNDVKAWQLVDVARAVLAKAREQ